MSIISLQVFIDINSSDNVLWSMMFLALGGLNFICHLFMVRHIYNSRFRFANQPLHGISYFSQILIILLVTSIKGLKQTNHTKILLSECKLRYCWRAYDLQVATENI